MQRREIVLAGLSPAQGGSHSPVQVQKLFFLIDQEVAARIGGPFFDFRPYHYGPFDKAVYGELDALAKNGLVEAHGRNYLLTPDGQTEGDRLLAETDVAVSQYIVQVSQFVRTQNFSSLVSAIYKKYPEMKARSVFQG